MSEPQDARRADRQAGENSLTMISRTFRRDKQNLPPCFGPAPETPARKCNSCRKSWRAPAPHLLRACGARPSPLLGRYRGPDGFAAWAATMPLKCWPRSMFQLRILALGLGETVAA